MTVSTETWYTGFHPYTMQPVFSAKTQREKLAQRLFFFWYKPEERKHIIAELRRIGRPDLIEKLYGKRRELTLHFFFRLSERKRCQKERTPAVPVGLLRTAFSLKGRNSLRSDSLPFLTASSRPPLHARRSMPESHAASSHTNATAQCRMAAPKRRGVKRRARFCVKNGRLSERSEFPDV